MIYQQPSDKSQPHYINLFTIIIIKENKRHKLLALFKKVKQPEEGTENLRDS